MRKLFTALSCAAVSISAFAASYVVPPDDAFIRKSDLIVTARALSSHVVDDPEAGIETVTEFAVEETHKGFSGRILHVRIPGGAINGRIKAIGGAPSFDPGTEYLLFLRTIGPNEVGLTDFGLGVFVFDEGRRFVRRNGEVFGWDIDGKPHRELLRDADQFIHSIRAVSKGERFTDDYVIHEPVPLSISAVTASVTSYTANSYMTDCGGGMGCRWSSFPQNWNQGNTEPGAPGTPAGKVSILGGFSVWYWGASTWGGGVVNYVWSTNNPVSNGALDPPDGINNVVFEKDLSPIAGPYSCFGGGLLGIGRVTAKSGTHTYNGETFNTTVEADVSMNQGIANCTTLFDSGDFNTALAHVVGETLGFRHSDQVRNANSTASCSNDPTLDCATFAIMNHAVLKSLSVILRTWDLSAVAAVYGAPCTSPTIVSQPNNWTIEAGEPASIGVTAIGTRLRYQWYTGTPGDISSPVDNVTSNFYDFFPTKTTSYWARAFSGACFADSNAAIITVGCHPPVITINPADTTISSGSSVNLGVGATGSTPLTFQWYRGVSGDTSNPVGTNSSAFSTGVLTSTTSYWVKVSNACNPAGVNSATATITVNPSSCPSVTMTAPTMQRNGSSYTLTTAASGGTGITIQWFAQLSSGRQPIGVGTSVTVSPTSTTTYLAQATNGCGNQAFVFVTVTIGGGGCNAPAIVQQPGEQMIGMGASVTLTVNANGGGTLHYQWYRGSTPDSSAPVGDDSPTFVTGPLFETTRYWVLVSNDCGFSTASSSTIVVAVAPSRRRGAHH